MENYFQMNFTPAQVNAITNLGLAHIGDGAYELLCRAYLCGKGDKTVLKLHRDTVEMVKAPTQARFADKLKPHLTEEELAYFRRGQEYPHPRSPKIRHTPGIRQGHRPGNPLRRTVSSGQDRPAQRAVPDYHK